jgi:hypothetical protein
VRRGGSGKRIPRPPIQHPLKIIPPALRALWIRCCRRWFGDSVIREPLPATPLPEPLSLHMVVSRDTWRMGLLALRSLEFQSGCRWRPWIHEDGTFGDEDARQLQALQPDATIVRRAEADARMSEFLGQWPICREHRMRHHWFIKFFDTFAFAPGERYMVLDSDIVFFRAPAGIREWAASGADTVHFMRDTRETYALPREDLERGMGFPFWRAVNSGICLMVKPAVSLDLAEKFLGQFAGNARHYQFLEQSLFALTGSAWNRGDCLPPSYEISWGNFRRPDSVCRHYVGPFKHDLLWVEGALSHWLDRRLGRRRA